MHFQRALLILTCLAIMTPVSAWAGGGRGGRAGGAAHPGTQHPAQQPITPEMHHQLMMQQFWYEQMMLNEMMRQPRGGYKRQGGQSQNGSGHRLATTSPQSAGQSQNRSSSTQSSNSIQTGDPQKRPPANQKPPTSSTGLAASPNQKSNQSGEKPANEPKKTSAETHHNRDQAGRRPEHDRRKTSPEYPSVNNQAIIGLLKNAYAKMSRADHDYGGHRVRSMEHVASALHHLGASSAPTGNPSWSPGNLPQSQSDQLLQEAKLHLRQVESTLSTGNNTFSNHHNARASVAAAIHELHVALNIN